MKRRKLVRADSLDLLLSTMTSSFGGMILIAILVALVSHGAQKATDKSRIVDADSEMLERRIATAKADIATATTLQNSLQTYVSAPGVQDAATLVQQRDKLKQEVDQATSKTSDLAVSVESSQAENSKDPSETLRALNKNLADLQREKTEEANRQSAMAENSERLKSRLADLSTEMVQDRNQRIRKLRLPKEREGSKQAFNFILRYNKLYPLLNVVDGDMVPNRESLNWEELDDDDGAKVQPIQGEGLDLSADKERIMQILKNIPHDDFYAASYVYGDSFQAFNAFKQLVLDAGLDYGWEPEISLQELTFGKKGTSPPPL
jgi:hypothetical protein